jgi:hypothetical protein
MIIIIVARSFALIALGDYTPVSFNQSTTEQIGPFRRLTSIRWIHHR